MAHRGRLNVLANIVGKKYSQIFREFEGNIDPRTVQGSGDVKYHLGAEGEFVAGSRRQDQGLRRGEPVAPRGRRPGARGHRPRQAGRAQPGAEYPVLPLLVHGDAAFAGQGVVAETLNLSQLRGYRTGGTIHVVVNNQVGFTTSPGSSRSSLYCTDVARMVQAPIFHVNGDDPEACIRVARLAFEYRQAFNKDVVIDLVCYRRRGHNEGDDPSYTQPLMYDLIEQKRSVRKLYTESLIGRGDITIEEAEQVLKRLPAAAGAGLHRGARGRASSPTEWTTVPDYPEKPAARTHDRGDPEETEADRRRLRHAARRLHRAPEGDAAAAAPRRRDHRRPDRLGHRRDPRPRLAADGRPPGPAGRPGLAPRHVRVRGSRRSSTAINADEWTPLANLTEDQAKFYVYDSLLSRVRRPRLRVRLLGGPPRRAGALGGAVRRLRQRRPDGHRRVHHLRRDQVAPAVRRRAAAPPRLRGPGPRPLLGPHRAVADDVRRRGVRGGAAVHARVATSTCCASTRSARSTGRWSSSRRSRCSSARRRPRSRPTSPRARSARSSATTRPTRSKVDTLLLCSRPDHLGPDGRAQPSARATSRLRRSPGSSSSTRARSSELRPSSRGTRTSRRSAGCRTSPPTWARGRTARSTCSPELDGLPVSSRSPGRRRRSPSVGPAQAARRGAEGAHRSRRSRRGAVASYDDVLHRPRASRSSRSAGVTRRSPWPGWPSGSRSSPTPTRSSRPPVERFATWLARLDDPDDD